MLVEVLEPFRFGENHYLTYLLYDTKKRKWIIADEEIYTVQYDNLSYEVIGSSDLRVLREFDNPLDALLWYFKPSDDKLEHYREWARELEIIKDILIRLRQIKKLGYGVVFVVNGVILEDFDTDKVRVFYKEYLDDIRKALNIRKWKRVTYEYLSDDLALDLDIHNLEFLSECKTWITEYNNVMVIYYRP